MNVLIFEQKPDIKPPSACALDAGHSFNLERPSHAYPTSYPPSCSYDPFPTERCFVNAWPRNHASFQSSTSSVDVDGLVSALSQLRITDDVFAKDTVPKHGSASAECQSVQGVFDTAYSMPANPLSIAVPLSPLPALQLAYSPHDQCPKTAHNVIRSEESRPNTLVMDASVNHRQPIHHQSQAGNTSGFPQAEGPVCHPPWVSPLQPIHLGTYPQPVALNVSESGAVTNLGPLHDIAGPANRKRASRRAHSASCGNSKEVSFRPYSRKHRSPTSQKTVLYSCVTSPLASPVDYSEASNISASFSGSEFMPSLSRMSSCGSLRSVSSDSSSSSDFEELLTPPSNSTPLPDELPGKLRLDYIDVETLSMGSGDPPASWLSMGRWCPLELSIEDTPASIQFFQRNASSNNDAIVLL